MERTPPQILRGLTGVKVNCEGVDYFPPRSNERNAYTRGVHYYDVGFCNVNWMAHLLHGADRVPLSQRCCSSDREPIKFNDGKIDMYRMRTFSALKNPGIKLQTDKKRDMDLHFSAQAEGKGVFFQYDGESRFAFSPDGKDFNIMIRRTLCIPVVLGPYHDTNLT